jgi:hypothetical protein
MPIDLETELNLRQDSQAVAAFVADNDGVIAGDCRDRGIYWLSLRPRSAPHERFVVRIGWERYPPAPPSVKFATEMNGRLDVTAAWPMIEGYRPGSFDICRPFTAEGYNIHPEWRTSAERWPADGGNLFLWVAQTLQFDLDNRYQGRSG